MPRSRARRARIRQPDVGAGDSRQCHPARSARRPVSRRETGSRPGPRRHPPGRPDQRSALCGKRRRWTVRNAGIQCHRRGLTAESIRRNADVCGSELAAGTFTDQINEQCGGHGSRGGYRTTQLHSHALYAAGIFAKSCGIAQVPAPHGTHGSRFVQCGPLRCVQASIALGDGWVTSACGSTTRFLPAAIPRVDAFPTAPIHSSRAAQS